MPSILEDKKIVGVACIRVLNLVISGMPSIPEDNVHLFYLVLVLNLVINGLSSIPYSFC